MRDARGPGHGMRSITAHAGDQAPTPRSVAGKARRRRGTFEHPEK